MIIYGNPRRRVRTHTYPDTWRDALIRYGEVEAAIADSLCPARDEPHPLLEQLRAIAIRVAAGELEALAQLPPLPAELTISVPEGYAYYGVYPEDYGKAAIRFFREVQPARAVVIGIRSIGTSLSAVVAAVMKQLGCPVRSFTIRPHGHPFDRHVSVGDFGYESDAHFLIVDEGPGLSGTSFASIAQFLCSKGVPENRIIFFPSWDTDGEAFLSDNARRRWRRHRKYTEGRNPFPDALDLSAGQWRQFSGSSPPVQPQHERRKYFRDGALYKFEGLGDYGESKLERASLLSEAGFTPAPISSDDGYFATEWITGKTPAAGKPEIAGWISRYLDFLAAYFPSDRPVPWEENLEMILVNVREGLGPEWLPCLSSLEELRSELCARSTVKIDGRLIPYEFVETKQGYVKTDTLDHHDDHFFPGCQDIAWDVAGAAIEFGLPQVETKVSRKCLGYYKIAYLSYRLGYCLMASASGYDQSGFQALSERYRSQLRYELGHLHRS